MTNKQKLFVEHYLRCWNATEAASQAGYKGNRKTLGAMGLENLEKPIIAKAIKKRLKESAMGADECLSRIAGHARSEDVKAMKALELIGKHHSLFTDRIEHSGHIDYTSMSDEKLKELAGRG
jgi:phage terminase small subunit